MRDRDREEVPWLRWEYRRAVQTIRRRLENTSMLVHVSILLFVPFLIGLLTYLSNHLDSLSFFLFPPLAAGTYALFANPESEYASPIRFVAGLTAGAVCAWIAMEVAILIVYPGVPASMIEVDAPGAAFAVFLVAIMTWAFDIEEAAAFSMALLGLLVDPSQQVSFIVSVFVASSIVATVFTIWRDFFYEQRARYLYESTKGDDHVLVPMEGELATSTAMLGGRLAAAHDAGKVVLLNIVDEVENTEESLSEMGAAHLDPEGPSGMETEDMNHTQTAAETDATIASTVTELEQLALEMEADLDVPCQVIVAARGSSRAKTVRQVAIEANCDLLVVPYETEDGAVSTFISRLLKLQMDVLVHRSCDGRTDWRRIMVPIRKPGDTAHTMIDFARRLAGATGQVSVAHCISSEKKRRVADQMLANVVETANCTIETRVANASITDFLHRVAKQNDLIVIGSSGRRSVASRLIAPPTFKQIDDLDADIAIVDRD